MKDKKCPKCSSTQVVHMPSGAQEYDPVDIVISKGWWGESEVVKISRYACVGCGYMEYWVDNPESLKSIPTSSLRDKGVGG